MTGRSGRSENSGSCGSCEIPPTMPEDAEEDFKKLADEVFAAKPKAGVRVGPAPIILSSNLPKMCFFL